MNNDPAPGIPPRPAYDPTMPAEAHRSSPPRWAWWVAGIVVPLAGIAASVFVATTNNSAPAGKAPLAPAADSSSSGSQANGPVVKASPPTFSAAPAPSLSPLPSKTPTPTADLTSPAGYTLNQTMFGLNPGQCSIRHEEQRTDLDTGQSRMLEPPRASPSADVESEGTELRYFPDDNCSTQGYYLRAMPKATVGILRKGAPQSYASCQAAANTGLGPLKMNDDSVRESRGLVVGAALCSVTDRGAIAMAVIEHVSGAHGAFDSPTVTGTLYVWSKST
ncbi:hypothetical protein [Streptomyces virginiae]|uniref:hypothetical protein n=1 Tax=Streptomyces virginiae TaxID=1961 RepID=UPI002F90984B|nr:hypothetical protein OG253_42070 [Streptomyces virginiae]